MSRENGEEDDAAEVKVHEIKFDEYGIMDDGLDASTNDQLKTLDGKNYIDWFCMISFRFLTNINLKLATIS